MTEGLSNILIDDILKSCDTYKGCFSNDNIPNILQKEPQFSIICNLDSKYEKGSHFICIISFPNFVLYIDPIGLPCFTAPIKEFLHSLNKPVFENVKQIQHMNSNFCSFYCMLFVSYFNTDKSTREKMFFNSKNLFENDKICVQYLKELIKKQ